MGDMIDRDAVLALLTPAPNAKNGLWAKRMRKLHDQAAALPAEDVRAGALDPATLEAVARMFDAMGNDAPLKGYECAKGIRGMIPEAKP